MPQHQNLVKFPHVTTIKLNEITANDTNAATTFNVCTVASSKQADKILRVRVQSVTSLLLVFMRHQPCRQKCLKTQVLFYGLIYAVLVLQANHSSSPFCSASSASFASPPPAAASARRSQRLKLREDMNSSS